MTGPTILFKVALVLISRIPEPIIQAGNFEKILNALSHTVPAAIEDDDSVISSALALQIDDSQLLDYASEFHKMHSAKAVYGDNDPEFAKLAQEDVVIRELHNALVQKQQQLDTYKSENANLQQQVNHSRSALHSLRLEAELHQTTIAQLLQANEQLKELNHQLQEDKAHYSAENRSLRQRLRSHEEGDNVSLASITSDRSRVDRYLRYSESEESLRRSAQVRSTPSASA